MYKKAFEASDKYDGEVLQVRSLERTKNLGKGFRFLLELVRIYTDHRLLTTV